MLNKLSSFATLPTEEVRFALALFFAAANARLLNSPVLTPAQEHDCQGLYLSLLSRTIAAPVTPVHSQRSLSLYSVFRDLWGHYNNDINQSAICARILAFHLMMERTYGSAVNGWTTEGRDESTVFLHPAVIQAIGNVSLDRNGSFSKHLFRQQIIRCAKMLERDSALNLPSH